jgi:D-arabinose 1-dehydrogenase-like Zn-dependent alcohol dehydrogenase
LHLLGGIVQAADSDFETHCVAKKLDEKVNQGSGEGSKAVAKEHWAYDVAIENKTFKDLSDLELKYIIFFNHERLGVKAAPTLQRQTGTFAIGSLPSHQKKSFSTEPVTLSKANLVGHYHYASGARPNAQDTLSGLWIRIYQHGQQIGEYANPSTLTKQLWE